MNMNRKDIWTSIRTGDLESLQQLVQDPENINCRNTLGETPLHLAASYGSEACIRILLQSDHAIRLNLQDQESGWTALHRSLYHRHLRVSMLLLKSGALLGNEPEQAIRDFEGHSPLDLLSLMLHHHAKQEKQEELRGEGEMYTFGKVDYQLGYHLPNAKVQRTPKRVYLEEAPGSSVIHVAAGKYHSCAITTKGQCFTWGFGRNGRLGHGKELNFVKPKLVRGLPSMKRVLSVSAGENHTLAIVKGGELYVWGSNRYGQLGLQHKRNEGEEGESMRCTPKRVDFFAHRMNVTAIAAGTRHSIVMTAGEEIYGFGSNTVGQLGIRDGFQSDETITVPQRVSLPVKSTQVCESTHMVVAAAASHSHTCILIHSQVWQFGHGSYRPFLLSFRQKSSKVQPKEPHHVKQHIWIPWMKKAHVSMTDIACGPNHSMAMDAFGRAYIWKHPLASCSSGSGSGAHCPEERQVQKFSTRPTLVRGLAPQGRVISISTAAKKCAVVTDVGDVFQCESWECELSNDRPEYSWKKVRQLKNVRQVSLGAHHTAVRVQHYAPCLPNVYADDDEENGQGKVMKEDMDFDDEEKDGESVDEISHGPSKSIPSLWNLAQSCLCSVVDVHNVVTLLSYAESFQAPVLLEYCSEFLRRNLDAVLVMMREKKEMELFEDMPMIIPTLGDHRREDEIELEIESKSTHPLKWTDDFYLCKTIRSLRKRLRQVQRLERQQQEQGLVEDSLKYNPSEEEERKLELASEWNKELCQVYEYLIQHKAEYKASPRLADGKIYPEHEHIFDHYLRQYAPTHLEENEVMGEPTSRLAAPAVSVSIAAMDNHVDHHDPARTTTSLKTILGQGSQPSKSKKKMKKKKHLIFKPFHLNEENSRHVANNENTNQNSGNSVMPHWYPSSVMPVQSIIIRDIMKDEQLAQEHGQSTRVTTKVNKKTSAKPRRRVSLTSFLNEAEKEISSTSVPTWQSPSLSRPTHSPSLLDIQKAEEDQKQNQIMPLPKFILTQSHWGRNEHEICPVKSLKTIQHEAEHHSITCPTKRATTACTSASNIQKNKNTPSKSDKNIPAWKTKGVTASCATHDDNTRRSRKKSSKAKQQTKAWTKKKKKTKPKVTTQATNSS